MAKRKNRSSLQNSAVVDSFISSVGKSGNDNSILTAVIFILGGLFAAYIGYIENNTLILLGGLVALVLGALISFKMLAPKKSKRR